MSNKVPTLEAAVKRYGAITTGKWAGEANWMTLFHTPDWFSEQVNGLDGKPCKRIYMNKDMLPAFKDALDNVKTRGLEKELKTFDGCFNIRLVRGSKDQQSTHSYGLAVDLNASENALGAEPTFSKELVACFTDAGFTWGGNFKRKDGQHFSFGWE